MLFNWTQRSNICERLWIFFFFAKNIGKTLSNKYSRKLFGNAKKSATDAIKTASKRAIKKKTAQATSG